MLQASSVTRAHGNVRGRALPHQASWPSLALSGRRAVWPLRPAGGAGIRTSRAAPNATSGMPLSDFDPDAATTGKMELGLSIVENVR